MGSKKTTREAFAEEIATLVIANLKEAGMVAVSANQESRESVDVWGTRQEAADIVKCSLPTIHGMMNQGCIIFRKCGRKTIINLTDLRHKLDDGTLAKYHRRG